MTMRISDPQPDYCSACHNTTPEGRYVDMEAMHDGGSYVDGDVTYIAGADSLHVCEACVRDAMEVLALRPEREQAQTREIKRLEIERDHWKQSAKRMEGYLQERPEGAPRQPRRRRALA